MRIPTITRLLVVALATCGLVSLHAQGIERARDLGIPFDGTPGRFDAITDVAGVEVGLSTIIQGDGPLVVGKGPVRTGVTAVLPRGKLSKDPVFAGWFPLNGNGEMTGTTWIEEGGFLEGPIFITNTHSVGTVRDAAIKWGVARGRLFQPWALPVVAETYDGFISDINGFHVKDEHVFAALDGAASGPVAEGNVGGGTGMSCYGFKCGTGTASRVIDARFGGYTVGVLVQANNGSRRELLVAGVPVGRELPRTVAASDLDPARARDANGDLGSIIIVVATDAPMMPHQLKRIAHRAALGLARTGTSSGNGSGDIFIAFSTANAGAAGVQDEAKVSMISNERISAVFEATVEATEEAIINALMAGRTMTGTNGRRVEAIPHDAVRQILRNHNRLVPGK